MGRERELIFELTVRRQYVSAPSKEEINKVLEKVANRLRYEALHVIIWDRQETLDFFDFEEPRVNRSKLALCAAVLKVVIFKKSMEWAMKRAEKAFYADNESAFGFHFDFGMGLGSVFGILLATEAEIAGHADNVIVEHQAQAERFLDQTLNLKTSPGGQAENYVRAKRELAIDAELLKKDPTGFLLVDSYVSKLKQSSPDPHQTKEYVVAGAELARDLYKMLYEIVE